MTAERRSLRDGDDLVRVLDGLHDCPFDLDLAVYDEGAAVWKGTFLLPLWDDPAATHLRRRVLVVESRLPVARVVIRLEGVKSARVNDDQGIGTYSFHSGHRTPAGLTLRFNEAMSIDIDLDGTLLASVEQELAPELRAVYRQFMLVQSGPRLERLDVT